MIDADAVVARLAGPRPMPSKVADLDDALEELIEPGATVLWAAHHARHSAALDALERLARRRGPLGLTLVANGVSTLFPRLVLSGAVRKAVVSFAGHVMPVPAAHRVLDELQRSGQLEVERWSTLWLIRRLEAAARGLPIAVLPPLGASQIGADVGVDALTLPGYGDVLVAPPLVVDVALVHAALSDEAGNAVVPKPWFEGLDGCYAARRGVVLTTERIVSTEVLGQHRDRLSLPGAVVARVTEVRGGAAPGGMAADLVDPALSYAEDQASTEEARRASRDVASFQQWTKSTAWPARRPLRPMEAEPWLDRARRGAALAGPASPAEQAAMFGALAIERLARAGGVDMVVAGAGLSALSCWLAFDRLRDTHVELVSDIGLYGCRPLPGNPSLHPLESFSRAVGLLGSTEVLAHLVRGHGRAISGLGALQVDETGALNTTNAAGHWFAGSGGGADLAAASAAVVVVLSSAEGRLVRRLDHVTSDGGRVRAVATPLGLLVREAGDERFRIGTAATSEAARALAAACEFPVDIDGCEVGLAGADADGLAVLRAYDPRAEHRGGPAVALDR